MNKRRLVILPVALLSIGFLSSCNDDAISSRFDNLQSQIDDIKNEIASLKTQIADLKKEMADADQAIKSEYDGKISEINETIASLNAQLETLTTQYQQDKEAITNDYNTKITNLKEYTDGKILELNNKNAELSQQIIELTDKHNTDKQALIDDYNAKFDALYAHVAEAKSTLQTNLNNAISNLESKLAADKQELTDDYNQKLAALGEADAAAREALTKDYNDKIAALEAKHDSDIAELESDYLAKLAQLEESFNTSKTALENDYNSKIDALNQAFDQAKTNLQNQINANKTAIETFASDYIAEKAAMELDYTTKIDNLRTMYEAKVVEIESSIATCNNSIDALRTEMNAALLANQNDYNAKINALTDRVAVLETETYHTVTFETAQGSHVENQLIKHGEKVVKPVDPTKPGFTFEGWTYNGNPWVFYGYVVTENITLTANWEYIDYTVTFKNDDGTVLETQTPVHYGNSVTYHGDIPIKPNPLDHYIYIFDGWDVDLTNITGDTVATAQYTAEYAPYTANFYDEEDNLLYSTFVKEGETAVYPLETPTKADDNVNKLQFQFSGWDEISRTSDTVNYKTHFESCTKGLIFEGNKVDQYVGGSTNVVIPAYWNGVEIKEIGAKSFESTSVERVTLPIGINIISDNAFKDCSALTSINIPNSVNSLGAYCFYQCTSLETILMPNSVNSLGAYCFYRCASLQTISISPNIGNIESESFRFCSSLINISIPEGVKTIGYDAFDSCANLKTVTLPDSITDIYGYAFAYCHSLTSINTPKNLKYIENRAFYYCYSLETFLITESIKEIGESVFDLCYELVILSLPSYKPKGWDSGWNGDSPVIWGYESTATYDGYTYGFGSADGDDFAFLISFDDQIEHFETPNTIAGHKLIGIKTTMFKGNETLKRVILPDCVKTIAKEMFKECTSLEEVVISEGVISIGDDAFYGDCNLHHLTIPDGLTSIGKGAFNNAGLKYVTWPKSISNIGGNFAWYMSNLYRAFYPGTEEEWNLIQNGALSSYSYCVEFESNVNDLRLCETSKYSFIASNDNRAYEIACINLNAEYINFEEEVPTYTAISYKWGGFENLSSLKTVVINSNITEIKNYFFRGCDNLEKIIIEKPSSSLGITHYAFDGNSLDIYFHGSQEEWNEKIFIETSFLPTPGINNIYYFSEIDLDIANTYWHYVDGVPTIWE